MHAFSRQVDSYGPSGEDPEIPADVLELGARLHGLPRHLAIHSGGMALNSRT
nr:hypothetical protein KPHV_22600 [Kitasatospora purpeofusca]